MQSVKLPFGGRAFRALAVMLVGGGFLLAMNACEGIKGSLGLSKSSPDEFAVVPSLPLSVPPDFQLRPPGTGGPGLQERPVREKAAESVFGAEAGQGAEPDVGFAQGEAALLRSAGATTIEPNIRDVIDREFSIYAKNDQGFLTNLMFWRAEPEPGEPLDPNAEAKRLKENAALGKPVTEGETPVIKRREKGMLEGIF
ncbi:MAG: DUF3035 domain-containing protein [Alphaproteobacteria bacterium]|nr:DUF3035 domain-containing protein [Alphaproteobacteria bacterium]